MNGINPLALYVTALGAVIGALAGNVLVGLLIALVLVGVATVIPDAHHNNARDIARRRAELRMRRRGQ